MRNSPADLRRVADLLQAMNEHRVRHGIEYAQVADAIEMDRSSLQALLNNKHVPSAPTVLRILHGMGLRLVVYDERDHPIYASR